MKPEDVLSKPSRVELYRSGVSGSAWLLFMGSLVIIGGVLYWHSSYAVQKNAINALSGLGILLGAWILGGILGFIGYLAVANGLKIERLRLAAHMLRSLNLHALLAHERNNEEALRLVSEAERREMGFIVRSFRAAGADVEQVFVEGVVDGIRRGSEPPYILIYRNGVLDAPSTLIANLTARTAGAVVGLLAFMFLGLIMLVIGILAGSILVYTTGRALKNHAKRENKVRKMLGLPETPVKGPSIGGLIASILTAGLYLPIYARGLTKSIDSHIITH
jgi:hypothetical protein